MKQWKIFQRIGAMLTVLCLLVGMMPQVAFAAGEVAPFKACYSSEEVDVDAENPELGKKTVYTIFVNGALYDKTEDTPPYEVKESESSPRKLTVTAANTEGNEAEWGTVNSGSLGSVTLYVNGANYPVPVLALSEGSILDGATVKASGEDADVAALNESNALVPVGLGSGTITQELKDGNGTVYASSTLAYEVKEPIVNGFKLKVGETDVADGAMFGTETDLSVTLVLDGIGFVASNMPQITVDETERAWADSLTFGEGEHSVSLKTYSYTFTVNKTAPTLTMSNSIATDDGVTVTLSGSGNVDLKSLKAGETSLHDVANSESFSDVAVTVAADAVIVLEDISGLKTQINMAEQTLDHPMLTASLDHQDWTGDVYINNHDTTVTGTVGNTYNAYALDGKLTYKKDNTDQEVSIADGASVTLAEDGVYTGFTFSAKETAEGKNSRTATPAEINATVVVDTVAPVVEYGEGGVYNGHTTFENGGKTWIVPQDNKIVLTGTVNDANFEAPTSTENVTWAGNVFTYTTDLTGKTGEFEIAPLTIVDKAGNEVKTMASSIWVDLVAPVMTVTVSSTGGDCVVIQNDDGSIYVGVASVEVSSTIGGKAAPQSVTVSFAIAMEDTNASDQGSTITKECNPGEITVVNLGDTVYKDKSGNVAGKVKFVVSNGETETSAETDMTDGKLPGLKVDRQAPSFTSPVDIVKEKGNEFVSGENVVYYDAEDELIFTADVSDATDEGTGVKEISGTIEWDGGSKDVTLDGSTLTFDLTQVGDYRGDVTMSVVITDKAGNKLTASRTVVVDRKAPDVTLTVNGAEAVNDSFFNESVTVHYEVEDLNTNFDNDAEFYVTYTLNGTETTVYTKSGNIALPNNNDCLNSLKLYVKDQSGNEVTKECSNITVDTAAPALEIVVEETDSGAVGAGDYHQSGTTYYLKKGSYSITAKLTESNLADAAVLGDGWTYSEGVYQYEGTIADAEKLTIALSGLVDKAGNTANSLTMWGSTTEGAFDSFTATYTADNSASDVTVTLSSTDYATEGVEGKIPLYDDNLSVTVTAKDSNTDGDWNNDDITVSYSLNNTNNAVTDTNSNPGTLQLNADNQAVLNLTAGQNVEDNGLSVTVTVVDWAGNITEKTVYFAVDTKTPVVEVSYEPAEAVVKNENYLSEESRTVTVKVTDQNFDVINSTITCDGTPLSGTDTWKHTDGTNDYIATYTFEGDGEHTFETHVQDLAAHSVNDSEDECSDPAVHTAKAYHRFRLDATAPVLTVSKNEITAAHTLNNVDYYSGDVTYTVRVQDANIASGKAELKWSVRKSSETEPTETTVDLLNEVDNTYVITLGDGDMLTAMSVEVMDNAGNYVDATELPENFGQADALLTYTGNEVVVDSTPMKLAVEVTAKSESDAKPYEIESFVQTANLTKSVFVVLDEKDRANDQQDNNGTSTVENPETVVVTVKMTLTDANITTEEVAGNTLINMTGTAFTVTPNVSVNKADSSIVFTASCEVPYDSLGQIKFALTASDLAGNLLNPNNIRSAFLVDNMASEGKFEGRVNIDRRPPASTNDTALPQIIVVPSQAPVIVNNLEIYNIQSSEGMTFDLQVTDDYAVGDMVSSGLTSVAWELTDSGNAAEPYEGKAPEGTETLNYTFTKVLPLKVAAGTESDEVKLVIAAMDMAGNKITYTKLFGVDNKNPEVKVTRTEATPNEVDNVDYFNKNVTYKWSVDDMTLDADNVLVTVTVTNVITGQDTKTQTWTSEKSGEFTLENGDQLTDFVIKATDDAGNPVVLSDESNVAFSFDTGSQTLIYNENPAVVDTKAPEVTVEYTDLSAVKNDHYISDARTAVITVVDDTFNPDANCDLITITGDETLNTRNWTPTDNGENKPVEWKTIVKFEKESDYTIDVNIADMALNKTEDEQVSYPATNSSANHKFTLDMTSPHAAIEKKVEENSSFIGDDTQDEVTTDYYNGKVTYTFSIEDANENLTLMGQEDKYGNTVENHATVTVTFLRDGTEDQTKLELLKDGTASFTVEEGITLLDFTIDVADNAGNNFGRDHFAGTETANPTVVDADAKTTAEVNGAGKIVYTAHDVVADLTAPELHFAVTAKNTKTDKPVEIEKLYQNKVSNPDVAYVVLKTSENDESGAASKSDEIEVTLTVTVSDRNLTLKNTMAEGRKVVVGEDSKPEVIWDEGTFQRNAPSVRSYTQTINVNGDKVGAIAFDVSVFDLAGNFAKEIKQKDGMVFSDELMKDSNGKYSGTISVDRMRPGYKDTDPPAISVVYTPDSRDLLGKTPEELDLYAYDVDISIDVQDNASVTEDGNKLDSGLASLSWSLDGKGIVENQGDTKTYNQWDDKMEFLDTKAQVYVYHVDTAARFKTTGESNNVTLTVEATDNAENTVTYQKTFGMDNQNPRVTVEYNNNDVENNHYFDKDRTLTVTVDDLNFTPATAIITAVDENENSVVATGWKKTSSGAWKNTATFAYDGDFEISLSVVDLTKTNQTTGGYAKSQCTGDLTKAEGTAAPWWFTVDKTAPVITMTYDNNNAANDIYFKAARTATIQIKEHNFRANVEVKDDPMIFNNAKPVTVTFNNGDGRESPVTTAQLGTWEDMGNDLYQTTVLMGSEGEYKIATEYFDLAGNKDADPIDCSEATYHPAGTKAPHLFRVDLTAPKVTVTKTVEENKAYQRSFEGADYYNDNVTYKVTVEDRNLTKMTDGVTADDSIAYAVVSFENGSTKTYDLVQPDKAAAGRNVDEEYSFQFTINDLNADEADNVFSRTLSDISIQVRDNAGNSAAESMDNLTVNDADKLTSFNNMDAASDNAYFDYAGNCVVVDKTGPVAAISFSDNVVSFYQNNKTNKNVVYVKLDDPDPIQLESGTASTAEKKTVDMYLTVKDNNITLEKVEDEKTLITLGQKDKGGEWINRVVTRNADSTITYKQSVAVDADNTGYIEFELNIQDLSSNPVDVLKAPEGMTFRTEEMLKADKGDIYGVATVDRRRPTTTDTAIPTITPVFPETPYTSANGLPLYAGAFSISLDVNDGDGNYNNAALANLSWTLSDTAGVVAEQNHSESHTADDDQVYGYHTDIDLNWGTNESNTVNLTVSAEDNVGNQVTYSKNFAVDNLAPRIAVTYDNNDVLNTKYFKATRTATVTITELNFISGATAEPNLNGTVITSQITPSAWTDSENGVVHTATCGYLTDGDYTLAVSSGDLAGNFTADNASHYTGEAPQDFTVDLTAPVINVVFDNNMVQNGKYYNADRTATITITEVNFNGDEVQVPMTASLNGAGINIPGVNGWTTNGEENTATVGFNYEGDFTMDVEYTDLAGNPAETITVDPFTVDKTAPEIAIVINGTEVTNPDLAVYSGDVEVTVSVKDINLGGEQNCTVTNQKSLISSNEPVNFTSINGGTQEVTFRMANPESTKHNDGVYQINASAIDLAGNTSGRIADDRQTANFSINRFGSTYWINDEYTKSVLGQYNRQISKDLQIIEINPNALIENTMALSMTVNGRFIDMERGNQYTMTSGMSDSQKWNEYTYIVAKDNFVDNGLYTISLYSEDEAGNKNTISNATTDDNEDYSGELFFWLDNESPIVAISGIENGERINAPSRDVMITFMDDSPITDVVVKVVRDSNKEELKTIHNPEGFENGQIAVTIDALRDSLVKQRQNIIVTVKDEAGNETTVEKNQFVISENALTLIMYSPLAVASIGAGVAGVGGVLYFLLFKRKMYQK